MKVSELKGAALALWTARLRGSGQAMLWTSPAGKRLCFQHPMDHEPFMPHENLGDCGQILQWLLEHGCGLALDESTFLIRITNRNRPGMHWEGSAAPEAICRAYIGMNYGEEVPDEGQ